MLKLKDLAQRLDFRLGPLSISPSRRHVEGPAGEANVEPLVMQAFLLLLHARGKVVTRTELFDQCWCGTMVGDDSLNRAISGVRRIAADTAPGLFEIETIPRTGYRLIGEILSFDQEQEAVEADMPDRGHRVSRRFLVGSGAAAVAGLGLWVAFRPRTNPQFDALMAQGNQELLDGNFDDPNVVALYDKAVRIDPGSAKAWGLLAYFKSTQLDDAAPAETDRIIKDTDAAVRRALAIEPKEPNALTASYILQGQMLDWAARDRQLRGILAIDGSNIPAMRELMILLQAAGLTRESWGWNERILQLAPLSRPHLVNRAQKLWIRGKVTEADKVIDHVRGLWPSYEFGFYVRLMILALTDRPRAALALLDSVPEASRPKSDGFWRAALAALDRRAPAAVEAARIICIDRAKQRPAGANVAVMLLCALGLTDDAFAVAEGFLLGRGKLVSSNRSDTTVNNYNRRNTPWLFTPPVAVMRADPRFLRLCEEFGIAAYWRARGIKPDYMLS